MNQYKVKFCDRNAIDPRDRETIQYSLINAETEAEARDIFECTNCEVISVELFETDLKTALNNQRGRILSLFEQEPLNKQEADELYRELLEVDDRLSDYDYTPVPSDMPVIDWHGVKEIQI